MSREVRTKRGGDRHRADRRAEEAKVREYAGEQMEQEPGRQRARRWGQ